MLCTCIWAVVDLNLFRTRVTLAAGFRAVSQKTQPDLFIVLRLNQDGFLPNPFIAHQSTFLSNDTVHSAVHCTESCITQGARKWIKANVIHEVTTIVFSNEVSSTFTAMSSRTVLSDHICMCICMYVCMYVCVCVCIYVFMYICMCLCMYVCMYTPQQ